MIKRYALLALVALAILAGSLQAAYVASNVHIRTYNGGATVSAIGYSVAVYNGQNVGVVAGVPTGSCAGVEYWRDGTRTVDAYAHLHTDC